jgi:protease I
MSTIGVIIDDMFEDVEYSTPAKALKAAGHDLVHIGLKKEKTVKGKKAETEVPIDRAVKECGADEFDALLIPGGYSPDRLRAHEEAVQFVRTFAESGKPIFSICHGPQLLITAQVLEGRKITGWKSIAQDIKNAGAEFIDRAVVEDGNIISSRHPGDLPAFVRAVLSRLEGKSVQ